MTCKITPFGIIDYAPVNKIMVFSVAGRHGSFMQSVEVAKLFIPAEQEKEYCFSKLRKQWEGSGFTVKSQTGDELLMIKDDDELHITFYREYKTEYKAGDGYYD